MPKPLTKTPPTSSVARLLDVEAATRAVTAFAPIDRQAGREPQVDIHEIALANGATKSPFPTIVASEDLASVKREIVLSFTTNETFSRLIELYRRKTGTRLSASHVARAMFRGISKCLVSLEREAAEVGRLKLPSNARGREGERDRFEDRIAQAFVNGIRAASAYRADE